MGTWCHIVVVDGADELTARAETEVRRLEDLWTRFNDASEVSRMNARAGAPLPVSPETLTLLRRAVAAFESTGGWFDPFLGDEIVAAGYDRTFADLQPVVDTAPRDTAAPGATGSDEQRAAAARRRPAPLVLDHAAGTAMIEPGSSFDPGGIGKGLAADMVAALLLERGASGALVNIGGDLSCRGLAPDDEMVVGVGGRRREWVIDLDDNLDDDAPVVAAVRLVQGGLCTSSPMKRQWQRSDGTTAHHLLDPATGQPAPIGPVSVTVIGPTACTAEVLTKAVYLAGPHLGATLLSNHNAGAIIVDAERNVHRLP